MNCEHLKKGDKIAICTGGIYGINVQYGTVTKVNKITLVAMQRTFYRCNGWEKTGDSWGLSWHIVTVEEGQSIKAEQKKKALEKRISKALDCLAGDLTDESRPRLQSLIESFLELNPPSSQLNLANT